MGYPGSLSVSSAESKSLAKWQVYLELTKPRINLLVLITTLTTMWVAENGTPNLSTVIITLIGTALAASSAGVFNQYLERHIDAAMARTSTRPLPAGQVSPRQALIFGYGLGIFSFVVLAVWVNLLTAVIALGGIAFYAIVYTIWLKPATPQNIVIGGAAGAVGPLIGWAAITGQISVASLIMFAIVFFWTPPHFWALALYTKDDYAKVNIPMLPVVAGEKETRIQIAIYSAVLFITSITLYFIGVLGYAYLATAVLLGVLLAKHNWQLLREASDSAAKRLFAYSIVYLFALFASMVVDVLLV